MNRQEKAVDVLARQECADALTAASRAKYRTRMLPGPVAKLVNQRVQEWSVQVRPSHEEFERAYDVLVHEEVETAERVG